jgi:hypothetical protein
LTGAITHHRRALGAVAFFGAGVRRSGPSWRGCQICHGSLILSYVASMTYSQVTSLQYAPSSFCGFVSLRNFARPQVLDLFSNGLQLFFRRLCELPLLAL